MHKFPIWKDRIDEAVRTHLCKPVGRSNLYLLVIVLLSISFLTPIASFSQSTIKIGFLIRDKSDLAILQAAQEAIQEANSNGGHKGQPFELVTRSCDGPWGMTSKQAVALIYEDQVSILVTALDGRNAHLAEQVAAKSHVVMLSTLSSDPTLSRAYVPWYFRIVPDDKQQARVLVEEIYVNRKAKNVALFPFDSYDGRKSTEAFEQEVRAKGFPAPMVFIDFEVLSKDLNSAWDAVVFAGTPSDVAELISVNRLPDTFAFLNFFNFSDEALQVKHVHTPFHQPNDYVFDGVSIAIESIKRFGPEPEKIRKGFRDLEYSGKTGSIRFDHLGNRLIE